MTTDDALRCGDLTDPVRLAHLAESGLGPRVDDRMEWFAARVRRWLEVPVALVSLVRPDEQVFPGAAGLGEPWASSRRTPLTHSFCQHVVATRRPLVIEDARADPLVAENLAVRDLGVVAYAGMPLTDESGHVLGSLCAIDLVPRSWRPAELEALADLAAACSIELRLRLARVGAERERARRDDLEESLRDAVDRSQTLLEVSRSVADSTSMEDVRAGLAGLTRGGLEPDHLDVLVVGDDGILQRLPGPDDPDGADRWDPSGEEPTPPALAVAERRAVYCATRREFDDVFGARSRGRLRDLDLHAVVAAPFLGPRGASGALVLGWRRPREFSPADLLLVSTVTAYTARAIDHVSWIQHRVTVAREMQQALLTQVPDVPGLQIAARYEPADAEEYVGGDWFDVSPLRAPGQETAVVISVGDIVGHELDAAIDMGQVRSMLRQAAWDRAAGPPSLIVHAFETANAGAGLDAAGTMVVAHLRRRAGGRWTMTWVNAGHPLPILVTPGETRLLEGHGRLFGLPAGVVDERGDQEVDVPPGAVLVLYSDGLVEQRGADIDERTEDLRAFLAQRGTTEPGVLADAVMGEFGRRSGDDVVVLVVRFD
ncbi:SpoIIE family protein phosphatase [Actinomycetospora lutea]|uniref:GAF domain-containing SpoIIE family protein phosphatase n=1 Tax=Actinomycetospora lutea TaxID=663604 RepID=UPI002366CE77|nr:SpoIIE family protein phosphatase [Actinomycetospora lutea]MDD7938211.1 SpoIIE family protein phosphatase [Actinomycetospora lutea]